MPNGDGLIIQRNHVFIIYFTASFQLSLFLCGCAISDSSIFIWSHQIYLVKHGFLHMQCNAYCMFIVNRLNVTPVLSWANGVRIYIVQLMHGMSTMYINTYRTSATMLAHARPLASRTVVFSISRAICKNLAMARENKKCKPTAESVFNVLRYVGVCPYCAREETTIQLLVSAHSSGTPTLRRMTRISRVCIRISVYPEMYAEFWPGASIIHIEIGE